MPGTNGKAGDFSTSWLTMCVLLASLAATFLVWHLVRVNERAHLRKVAGLVAEAVEADVSADVNVSLETQAELAKLWEFAEPSHAQWEAAANLFIQHHPGCVAVEWLDPHHEEHWQIAPEKQPSPLPPGTQELRERLLRAALQSRRPALSPTFLSPNGERLFWGVVPVFRQEQLQGFVLASFEFNRSLDYILSDVKGLNFSIAISEDGRETYRYGDESASEWAGAEDIVLPGVSWHVQVWPRPEALEGMRTRLAEAALLVGILVASLLTLTVHLGQKAAAKSASLQQSNRRVEESLHALSGQLLQLQDAERRRFARELHDGATQSLTALHMNLSAMRDGNGLGDSRRDSLTECIGLVDQSLEELRTISFLLHPPLFEMTGLRGALPAYVRGFSERSGIQVSLDIPAELGRLARDVEVTVYRIVQEALSNVHRHSHSSTAQITLSQGGDRVTLEVTDQGAGMPGSLDDHRLGVGITGMRERVRLLGGSLEIESSGRGTTMRAVLPTILPARVAEGARQISTLVVEDSPAVLRAICSFLLDQPNLKVVATARDGEEAVALAERLRPELVLMDVEMPRMDGIEATLQLGKQSPATRVVIVTAFDTPELRQACLKSGACGFIRKKELRRKLPPLVRQVFGELDA